MRTRITVLAISLLFISIASAQLRSQTAEQRLTFEVTSIKPSPADSRSVRFSAAGGRFSATRITLRTLLQMAYRPKDGAAFLNSRMIGVPGWIDSDHFDIEATTEDTAGAIPQDMLRLMVQSLLEDRFKLKARWETWDMPVYLLTIGKSGVKLKLSEDQRPYGSQPLNTPIDQRRGMMRRAGEALIGNAVRVSELVSFLSAQTGRPVLDKTGLAEGLYDFKMNWLPPPLPAPTVTAGLQVVPQGSDPGASIFAAIQELGLTLDSANAPLDVLVIDSVQKPTVN